MRTLLMLLSVMLMCSACSKDVSVVDASGLSDPVVRSEEAIVELRVGDAELFASGNSDAYVWDKARILALQTAFQKMLLRDTVFLPVDGMGSFDVLSNVYTQTGVITPVRDEETGDLVQNFRVKALFVGDLALGGEIVTLEEGVYMASAHDTAYALFYDTTPKSVPAYVLIAEPVHELGSGLCRIIGMGEILETPGGTVRLPLDKGGAMGQLCSLEVVVSKREVEAGDKIFLMSVALDALDSDASLASDPDVVVIEPLHSDVVPVPQEQK